MKLKSNDLKTNYLGLRLSDGGGIFLTTYVMIVFAQIALLFIFNIMFPNLGAESPWVNFIYSLFNQTVFFVTPFIYGKLMRKPMLEPSRIRRSVNLKQIVLAIVIPFACICAFLPLADAFVGLIYKLGYPQTVTTLDKTWYMVVGSLVFSAVLPAIGEEFLFRGSISRAFKTKSYLFAVLLSSLFFALWHGNPEQLVYQFFFGVVLAISYFITGSLITSVIMHFVNNATVLLISTYIGGIPVFSDTTLRILQYVLMTLVGLLLVILLLRMLTRTSKKRAGLAVGKVSVKNFFVDMVGIFTPKGIKKFESTLSELYNDPMDNVPLENNPEEVNSEDEKTKKLLIQANKDMQASRRRIDRIIVILALALVVFLLIFNTIQRITAQ